MSGLTIKTECLRNINRLSKTNYKVLVTRFYPFYIKNVKSKINEWLPILAPDKGLLADYNDELKRTQSPKLAWALSKYDTRFRFQILHDTVALGELKRIRNIGRELRGKRIVYLICYESTDEYCHRRILKELMEKYEL